MIEIPDDGFVKVKLADAELDVDLYKLWNDLHQAQQASDGTPSGLHDKIVQALQKFGFPAVSHRAAVRLMDALQAAIDELKKKETPTPTSPSTTEPQPSPSPAASS